VLHRGVVSVVSGLVLVLLVAVLTPFLVTIDPAPGQSFNPWEGLIVVPLLLGYAALAVGLVLLVIGLVRKVRRRRS